VRQLGWACEVLSGAGGEMRVQGSCPAADSVGCLAARQGGGGGGGGGGGAGWEEEEVLDSGGLIRGPAAGGLQQGHFSLCRGGDAAGWRAGCAGLRAGREGRLDLRYTCGRPAATCGRPAAPCFRFAAGEWGDGGFSRRERGEGHGGWGSGRMRGRRGRRVCAYAAPVYAAGNRPCMMEADGGAKAACLRPQRLADDADLKSNMTWCPVSLSVLPAPLPPCP